MLSLISIFLLAAAISSGSLCSASYFLRSLRVRDAYQALCLAIASSVESLMYRESSFLSSRVSPAIMRESRTWALVVESFTAM